MTSRIERQNDYKIWTAKDVTENDHHKSIVRAENKTRDPKKLTASGLSQRKSTVVLWGEATRTVAVFVAAVPDSVHAATALHFPPLRSLLK
jgi:hypothetical protein